MAIKNKKQKLMVSAVAGAMAATIAVGGGTFAYLQGQTNEVVNQFDPNKVEVSIDESANHYEIIPGTVDSKDPKLTVSCTLPSFLFVTITEENIAGLVEYDVADGWTKLDGVEGNVYYRMITPDTDATTGKYIETTKEYKVLKDDQVKYPASVTSMDMTKDYKLSFQGFAIQAQPFTDPTDPADPTTAPTEADAAKAAYNKVAPVKVSSEAGFRQALNDVENGGVIKLEEDVTNSGSDIRLNNGKQITIDLGGHTLNSKLYVDNADVTIKNGTIHSTKEGFQFSPRTNGDSRLVISNDVTVKSDVRCSVLVADLSDGTHSGVLDLYGVMQGCIFVHGTVKQQSDITVNVYGSIDGGNENKDIGVAVNGYATVNVKNGATVKSMTGIEVRAGKLNVEEGATVIGNDAPASFEPNSSGTTTKGAGIAVAQHTTKLPIDVNIAGGTIRAYAPLYEVNPQNNSDADLDKITINVTGGTFENINGGTAKFSIADREKIHYTNSQDS